jgi:leader peptidase (prepilin peptidase)/N-methyltransferase
MKIRKEIAYKAYFIFCCLFFSLTYCFFTLTFYFQITFFILTGLFLVITDYKSQELPLYLTSPLFLLGIYRSLELNLVISRCLFAALVFFCCILVFILSGIIFRKETFALGDALLLSLVALNWGSKIMPIILYISLLSAGLFSLVLLLSKRKNYNDKIAFAPFIMFAFLVSIFINKNAFYELNI